MEMQIALASTVDITQSPQFKKWFKNSKCLRAGKPRVLYHATSATFSAFSHSYTVGQMGFHLGTSTQAKTISSHIRGERKRSRMLKVYASIQNPIRLEDQGGWHGYEVQAMVNEVAGLKLLGSGKDSTIRQALIKNGYDGVVYKNKFEGTGDSFIAFYPHQIKLVDNTSFDSNSEDLDK